MAQIATEEKMKILVVGDWFVDAHWVLEPHESDIASRRGKSNSRAAQPLDSSVRSLCGAGQVARLLNGADWSDKNFKVVGMGNWHWRDSNLIRAMLHQAEQSADGSSLGDNPHHVTVELEPHKDAPNLHRLVASEEVGTNRVVRLYKKASGDKYELIERWDWELDIPLGATPTLPSAVDLDVGDEPIIVVKDHGRNTITPELVEALKKQYKNSPWYVSTKSLTAPWLRDLPREKVKLLLVQPVATEKLSFNDSAGTARKVQRWILKGGIPTRDGMRALDGLCRDLWLQNAAIVVMTARATILAKFGVDESAQGYTFEGSDGTGAERFVPLASVLFPALIFNHLSPGTPWDNALDRSMEFTNEFRKEEIGRITKPETWKGNDTKLSREISVRNLGKGFDWKTVMDSWEQAYTVWPNGREGYGEGVVTYPDGPRLDLWRSMTDVDDCICIAHERRKMVRRYRLSWLILLIRKSRKAFMFVMRPVEARVR